ncbi:peptide deformylase [Candidatus Kaiserbacteria bacterium]|nr:peptide deformylase [Candidatus Kaiserbacteria bacterium]
MRTILPADKNGVLRQKAKEIPVSEIMSARIKTLIREMKALLAKEEHGVALAAPQVGEPLRLFIVSGHAIARGSRSAPDEIQEATPLGFDRAQQDQMYINPELLKVSRGKKEKHEGCLSIRGKWGTVPRAEKVRLSWYDERGKKFQAGFSGFLAHVFQHEMDHLEGILYIDKATHVYDEKDTKHN